MAEAQYGYLRWGATAKASDLGARYPHLLTAPARDATAPSSDMSAATAASDSSHSIDVVAMIRAAHAIAGEIELSSLLKRLMRIVVEDAGADRGVLLLAREGELLIEATMTVQPDVILVGMGAPIGEGAEIPVSVVSFVERTTEPVVIGDASNAGPFAGDPYILARAPRSILCLAMMHQGGVIGVLYLENRAARDAFTRARVELSGVLAAQAAIAVENARMVAELRHRSEALGAANAALSDVNAAMHVANERLSQELWEREQAEAARLALKEELYRVQTPIIPITDRVTVMPLVGTIDAERARQVLETALTGAQRSRAAVVILDITGVERVDAGVAGSLVSTASALRLLGAQAVITGVRPEVAQALVALNLDLGAVVTRGTLESGVAYAMDRLKHKRL